MLRGVIRLCEHSFALIRVFLLITFICFVPRFFVNSHKEHVPFFCSDASEHFTLGLENLQKEYVMQLFPKKEVVSIGLVTHEHATDCQGVSNVELLQQKNLPISKLLYLEHDLYVNNLHMHEQPIYTDGIDRYMLHKQEFSDKMLEQLDLLLIDLPDIEICSVRTIYLLFRVIQAAADQQLPIVILDRPNLLGHKVEGPPCHMDQLPIGLPIRHGMTTAELAHYYNIHALHSAAQMHIVPMHNYHRAHTSPLHASIVPHINQLNSAYGFTICGILAQVAPFDIGLDTDYSYSCIMLPQSVQLPEQRWYQLQVMLRQLGVENSFCRHFSTRKNETCRGLRFHINDVTQIDSFKVLLVILEFFKRSGVLLAFDDSFDIAVGTPLVRQYLQGKISKRMLTNSINSDLESFYRKAFGAFMYHPLPQVSLV